MRFSVLSSGSKANATVVIGSNTTLLIDCGLSCKELEKRLAEVGVAPESINGVLITHEHYDHVRGLERFTKRYNVPVFCNRSTKRAIVAKHYEVFDTGASFSVGEITVKSFSISHDAVDPVGFSLTASGVTFSMITDLGVVTPAIRDAFRRSHSVLLESNHDVDMLASCMYPQKLKERIASNHGHLSNTVAAKLIEDDFHHELYQVVLGHLSENSNKPEIARAAISPAVLEKLGGRVVTASVQAALPVMPVAA